MCYHVRDGEAKKKSSRSKLNIFWESGKRPRQVKSFYLVPFKIYYLVKGLLTTIFTP